MPKKQFHYKVLQRKWLARHKKLQEKLAEKHGEALEWLSSNTKQLAAGSLGGLLLLTSPATGVLPPPTAQEEVFKNIDKSVFLISDLSKVLPTEVRTLSDEEEQKVSEILSRTFNLKVSASLSGKRLNRSYGLIGAEQHLARYPGDTIFSHFATPDEASLYSSSGMAPGLGAWGYFAPSRARLSETDMLREKYYIATQTFLAQGFHDNVMEYIAFFKYRKMLVVNPQNGQAIVVVIGDAGPAEWTGKHLGGSPEVMRYLERKDGAQKGHVLYFFIDDLNDTVPLGPIEL